MGAIVFRVWGTSIAPERYAIVELEMLLVLHDLIVEYQCLVLTKLKTHGNLLVLGSKVINVNTQCQQSISQR